MRWSRLRQLKVSHALLLLLLPAFVTISAIELRVRALDVRQAANRAFDRSLLGALRSIDASVSTEAGGLSVELPYRMFEFFEHDHPRAFAHDESIAADIERTRSFFWLLISRAHRLHGAETGNTKRNDGCLRPAREHDIRRAHLLQQFRVKVGLARGHDIHQNH